MSPSSTTLVAKKIDTATLARPVFATSPPRDRQRLFIVEQHTGKVRILRVATNAIDDTPFLQVSGLSTGNEQGLLGLAFAPDFDATGFLYVNFTDTTGATVIRRYKVSATDPDRADPASAANVMTIPQPFANHNGGWIAFSPKDRFLYIGMGDGGSANDPNKTAQNPNMLLGKMLRIDVTKDSFTTNPAKNYAIPTDNPFVGMPGHLPEVWALGLRNPWRCSFDRKTGDLYIGDVGQFKFEEIDFQRSTSVGGENYGWSIKEGTHPFRPLPGPAPALIEPILDYSHDNGEQAVIGGYVYRGAAIPDLQGTYFFADTTGIVSSLVFDGAAVHNSLDRTAELFPTGSPTAISSFAEDASGEMYLLNLEPGELYKIVPKD